MNSPASRRGWSWETRFCVLLFGASLVIHLCLSAIGWDNTLLGPHSFRQAQTAVTTFHFLQSGATTNYITPILGPPWEIPLEFPLFQACAAWAAKATNLNLDSAGRLTSWLFFISLLPACYLLLGRFRVPPAHRLIFLALLLLSPLYIFFSRSFMIESAAVSLGAWFLLCFSRFVDRSHGGWSWLIGALAFGALAGGVKVTTFAIFLLAAFLILWGSPRTPGPTPSLRKWLRGVAAVTGPLLLSTLWLIHTAAIRHRNPEAGFLDDHFGFWSFGDLAQRVSPAFWARTFRVWSGDIISEAGIVLLVLYYGWLGGRYRNAVTGCLVTFLSGQLIFSNLYFVHAYYFYANGLFLIAAVGFFLAEMLEQPSLPVASRWILTAVVVGLQVSAYTRTYSDFQRKNLPVSEAVAVLNAVTSPDDIVIIVGQDWDASFPYYAERRALMLPRWREYQPEGISQTVQRLETDKIAAILIDGARWRDGEFVQSAFNSLEPGSSPFLAIQDLGIWVPKNRQAQVRDLFDPDRFPAFELSPESKQPGEARSVLAREIQRRSEFKYFQPRPVRATSANQFTLASVGGREIFNAHAPTELVFKRSTPLRHLSAEYGIEEGAYAGKEATDGVEIVVAARQADQTEKILFRRVLNPQHTAADRGLQKLDLAVELPANTEVYIRTLPGPSNGNSFDWSYFGNITLR